MELNGKNVVVVGIGRSALGATALLCSKGAKVFVSDASDTPAAREWSAKAQVLGATVELGKHTVERFNDADLIVMSPGVPPAIAPVSAAQDRGVPVIAELELGARFAAAPMLAVTGTNGKTTTTELLWAMARACGRDAVLAGNNKVPLSQAVLEHPEADCFVVEVSSYQLETIDTFRPKVAAVLNLTPDHLGRHGDMKGYASAKARIFMNLQAGDTTVLNADDTQVSEMPAPSGVARATFSVSGEHRDGIWCDGRTISDHENPLAQAADCPVPGRHNLANALAALAIAKAAGLDLAACVEALRTFKGVEHRIEWVARIDGVDYYNDSKSTNIDSLRVALDSFSRPVVLIAGGQGKGASYEVLSDCVSAHVKHLIGIGDDGPALVAAFEPMVSAEECASMKDAVARAGAVSATGDVVLLSPGCASFDMYSDFEARGKDFKHCVQQLASTNALSTNSGASA